MKVGGMHCKWLATIAIMALQQQLHAETNVVLPKFTITGYFTRELWGQPLVQRTGFTIASHGKGWEIRTQALQPQTRPNAIRSAVFKYDGWYVSASVGPNSEVGDFIPPAWSSYVPEQLWLAYLSGPYFATNTSAMARPVWHLDDEKLIKERFQVQTRREPLEAGLGQPRIVEFLSDGKIRFRREQGPGHPRAMREVVPYPAPFDSGFIEAVFQVNSVTNVSGINLPKEFTFEKYGPRPEKPGEKPQVLKLVTTRGYTETIKFDSPPSGAVHWKNPKPFDLANPEYQKALENSAPPSKTDAKQQF